MDGGTSRFDKQGRVYHSVCGSCGSAIIDGFTTTMGVVSNTANSANCNMAVFKFDLNAVEAIVSTPNAIVCIPDPVIFNNGSLNGNTYFWNFGDGNTSTVADPIHYYTSPGVYTVTLIVSDSMACRSADSVQLQVTIEEFIGGIIQPTIPVLSLIHI